MDLSLFTRTDLNGRVRTIRISDRLIDKRFSSCSIKSSIYQLKNQYENLKFSTIQISSYTELNTFLNQYEVEHASSNAISS